MPALLGVQQGTGRQEACFYTVIMRPQCHKAGNIFILKVTPSNGATRQSRGSKLFL